MAIVTIFDAFPEAAAEGKHNLAADALKVALTDTAPVMGNTVFTDIAEIPAGNGYTAGGVDAVVDSSSRIDGKYRLVISAASWTANGGDIASHRYAVLYNDTAAAKDLIAYADYGVSAVIADGNSDTANGIWIGA